MKPPQAEPEQVRTLVINERQLLISLIGIYSSALEHIDRELNRHRNKQARARARKHVSEAQAAALPFTAMLNAMHHFPEGVAAWPGEIEVKE